MSQNDTESEQQELEAKHMKWFASARKQMDDLLLNKGLYQRIDLEPPRPVRAEHWTNVLPERFHRDCEVCEEVGQTTWFKEKAATLSPGLYAYSCSNCRKNRIDFMLTLVVHEKRTTQVVRMSRPETLIDLVKYSIEKTGQYPAWMIPRSKALKKALGKEGDELFVKGASSLRAGRGIGAVAYFRRIIENHVDDILKMVSDSAAAAGDVVVVKQIEEASRNRYASERLRIAAQHTPPHLKPGGRSPLDVMYEAFSEGLHSMSDKEAADVAHRLLESITYFFKTWQEHKEANDHFVNVITKTATKSS